MHFSCRTRRHAVRTGGGGDASRQRVCAPRPVQQRPRDARSQHACESNKTKRSGAVRRCQLRSEARASLGYKGSSVSRTQPSFAALSEGRTWKCSDPQMQQYLSVSITRSP